MWTRRPISRRRAVHSRRTHVRRAGGCTSCCSASPHEAAGAPPACGRAAARGRRPSPAGQGVPARGARLDGLAPRVLRARIHRPVRAGDRVHGAGHPAHRRGGRDLRPRARRGAGFGGERARGERGVLRRAHTRPGLDGAAHRGLAKVSGARWGAPRARYNLTVIGAGPAGLLTAIAAAGLGARVALIERAGLGGDCLNVGCVPSKTLLAAASSGLTFALALKRVRAVRAAIAVHDSVERYTAAGVDVFLGQASFASAHEIRVGEATLRTRRAVIATGVRADPTSGIAVNARLQTSHPHIYAAGDVCSALQFTHAADAQARVVVRNALFPGSARADRLVMPKCTYTRPELAHVGASSRDLDRAGRAFDRYRVEFGELDRGLTDDSADGYAEVLTARGTDRILGATIVGKDAGEQLSPVVLALTLGLGLERLGPLVLPYPTRSEYLRRIIDAHARTRLTPLAARTLRWWLTRTR